jgi:hypothetical protein
MDVRKNTMAELQEFAVEKAIECVKSGMERGVWTIMGMRSVLVGYASKDGYAGAILIPIEKYDGFKLMEYLEAAGG